MFNIFSYKLIEFTVREDCYGMKVVKIDFDLMNDIIVHRCIENWAPLCIYPEEGRQLN